MYPFERFTEYAKRALTFTQEEAERLGAGYIGTEHLLLGLLRGECLARRTLATFGVTPEAVRAELAGIERDAAPAGLWAKPPVPTESVKTVITLAFQVAEEMGQRSIGTEHLLLGLLAEDQSLAVHALRALGADHEAVRAQLERLLTEGGEVPAAEQKPRPKLDPAWGDVLDDAAELAALEGAPAPSEEHMRMAMDDDRLLKSAIQSVRDVEARRQDAVDGGDLETAARLRAEGQVLRERLGEAMAAWRSRQA
jgi:ATP-dependent Clp protease ATP-binding subunit ClpA